MAGLRSRAVPARLGPAVCGASSMSGEGGRKSCRIPTGAPSGKAFKDEDIRAVTGAHIDMIDKVRRCRLFEGAGRQERKSHKPRIPAGDAAAHLIAASRLRGGKNRSHGCWNRDR